MSNAVFTLTVISSVSGVLTKKLKYAEGKLVTTPPAMMGGFANKKEITTADLPDLISNLSYSECLMTGTMQTDEKTVEVLTTEQFKGRGYTFPVHKDDTGTYGTRSLNSVGQSGPSFFALDYDPDPQSPLKIDTPEQFLKLLDQAVPELGLLEVDRVRTYSTSSGLKWKKDGTWLRPPEGFHILIPIQDGSDLERFNEALRNRCWLAGLGHIKVSKNGSRLERTLYDTAVLSPERLLFEGNAYIDENQPFYQERPKPDFTLGTQRTLDTRVLTSPTKAQLERVKLLIQEAKSAPKIVELVEKRKQFRVSQAVHSNHYKQSNGRQLTETEARRIIDNEDKDILYIHQLLDFADGRQVSVLDAMLNAASYDGVTLRDPLKPDSHHTKAKFYANLNQNCGPIINSFSDGGKSYKLNDSLSVYLTKERAKDEPLSTFDKVPAIYEDRYFREIELKKAVTLVKGEKGTGKTTAVAKAVRQLSGSILAITHRISLAEKTAKDFDLACYNEVEMQSNPTLLRHQAKLAICLNSITKLEGRKYDTLIVDEFVQLLQAFTSSRLENAPRCLKIFKDLVSRAERVVLMDADLSHFEIELCNTLGIFDSDTQYSVVINTYKPAKAQQRTVFKYADDNDKPLTKQFKLALLNAVDRDKVFMATNSLNYAKQVQSLVLRHLGILGEIDPDRAIYQANGRRVILIGSHTSQSEDIQEYLASLNTSEGVQPGDVLISTPSIGTGVSIDMMEGGPRFPVVFAHFTKQAGNTPTDCTQHLSRVRGCQEFHVSVRDNAMKFETQPSVIALRDVQGKRVQNDTSLKVQNFLEYDAIRQTFQICDAGWTDLYSHLKAHTNEQRNDFGLNFWTRLEIEGYEFAEPNLFGPDRVQVMATVEKQIKEEIKTVEKEKLLDAPWLSDEEFEKLNEKALLSPEDKRAVYKKRLANTFGFDDQTQEFESLLCQPSRRISSRRNALIFGADAEDLWLMDITHRLDEKRHDVDKTVYSDYQTLAFEYMAMFGVTSEHGFMVYDGTFINTELRLKAADWMIERAREMEVVFRIKVFKTKDSRKKTAWCSSLLNQLGFYLERKSVRVNNKSVKVSKIRADRIVELNEDLQRASKHSTYGFYSDTDSLLASLAGYAYQLFAGTPELDKHHVYVSAMDDGSHTRLVQHLTKNFGQGTMVA